MKKYLLTACLLTALPVQAQMFDFSNMVQPIQISEEFVNNLTTCTPFEETKDTEFMGFDMHVTYNIKGKENDECMVEMYSETMGINSLQRCHFTDEDIAMYVPALRYVLENMEYTVEGSQKMMKNEKWQLAMSMMMDEEKCKYFREAVDLTKELRENLRACSPYSATQETGPTKVVRTIIGPEDDGCAFEQEINQKQQDLSAIVGKEMPAELRDVLQDMPEMKIKIKCNLSAEQLREYEEILEGMVIPAAESMEEAIPNMNDFNPRAEAEFMQQNCDVDVDDQ